jgi:7,8-dihydropterin-6-yl-methyl-4-(beta-D-ribofuranosyl)aminobenzene 5'-phosphate synthase
LRLTESIGEAFGEKATMSKDNQDLIGDGKGSSRRGFLKAGLAVAAGLGFARGSGVSGGERPSGRVTASALTGPIGLLEVDSLDVWCLEDNFTDVLLASSPTAIRPPLPPDLFTQRQFITEHGFSTVVTVQRNGQSATLLYDGGLSPDAIDWNMEKLGLPADHIAAVVLSHGHIDHHNGLDKVIRKIDHQGLPLVVHPEVWLERRAMTPAGPVYLPPPDRQHLEGGGVQIIERREPSLLLNDTIAVTGEIARVTPYETGFPPHQKLTAAGWVPDPLIWDDQALVCNLKGKGLVVVSGCAHAGVINTLLHAQALTGVSTIYAFVGGLHLSGAAFEPRIAQTVADLAALQPSIVVPAHCTGWKAAHAIAAALPDAFIQNSVGTRYHLV